MITAEELLKPVSADKPCGEDLSYDPAFQQLETLMRGKEETQFSPAEEPDWKVLRTQCLELSARTKDFRLAATLAVVAAKTDGFPGVRESLALILGLIEKYWDSAHPVLDPADNNDPTQRVNAIASLAMPIGTYGDPLRFLERLRQAPLTNSARMGRFTTADILRSEAGETVPDQPSPPAPKQIEAAFRDTSPDDLQATNQALLDCLALASAIDEILTRTVGSTKAPDLELLPKELKEIQKRLIPYLAATGVALPGAENAAAGPGESPGAGPAQSISGDVQTRQDVVRMLDKICDYFQRHEPSSPVPLLLRRAQRWTEMSFMQVIDELVPDAVKEVQKVSGEKPKEGETS